MGHHDYLENTSQIYYRGGIDLWNSSKYSAITGKYSGGTGILLNDRLTSLIEEYQVIIPSRAQHVTLRISPQLKIGIMNIYGYNQLATRVHMWNTLKEVDFPDA
jgi:hypothetical protein